MIPASARTRAASWGLRADRATVVIVVGVVGVGAALGLLATAVGPPLTGLGGGLGGGGGLPFVLLIVALLVGCLGFLLAAVGRTVDTGARRPSLRGHALVPVGAAAVWAGYLLIAHATDPCSLGVWDLNSAVGDVPLCYWYFPSTDIHPRFHLLDHAGLAIPVAVLYLAAIRRWYPQADPFRWLLGRR